MTVKELHTFTDADIETIVDALRITNAHYQMLAEMTSQKSNRDFRDKFEAQAHDASQLQLKIEAAK